MIKRATGLLGAFEPSAWYRFTVAAPSTVNLDLGLAFGTAVVGLYDSSGSALIQSDPATTAGDGWIDRFLASGTYSVQVSSRGDAAYTLTLSSGVPPVGVSTTLYAGTSQAAATALGTLGATPLTIPEWIGPGNPDDWYAFTVASVSSVQATLSGLSNGVTVTLYTTAGQLVASATGTASSNASLLRTVAAGNYLLDIGGAAASGYSLSLAAPPVPEGAGPTAALARDFGVLGSAGAQVVDQLNAADSADYYQFEVGTNAAVALLLSGVTDAATVTLYDGSGAVLSSRSAGLASNAWLNSDLAPLPVGTSYVIGITGTRPTSYTLKLSEAPYVKITGATAGTATDAGTLGPSSVTLAGTLRPLANNQYYSFTLDTPQTVSIAVTAEQSTLLQLYGSDGSSIGRTNPPGTAPGTILAYYALQAGTYYADITDDSTIGAQNYSINLSTASPLVGTPDTNFAGITPATAQVIGLLSPAVTSFADWVGATNPDDYYQFTLGTESYARFDLTGLTENATVTISDLTGRVLFTQPSSVYSAATGYDASVTALLLAGSYILDVSDPSQVGTGYNLNASAAAVSDPAGHTRATADALGSVDVTPQSVSGVIAPLVPDDYYTFILTRAGTVNLLLSNTTQVASISLRDSAGQPLGSSQTAASPGSSVMEAASLIQTLAPGTYVVDVQAAANAASPYTLGLSASPVTLSGNAAINATGLGTLRNTAGQPIALEDFGLRGTSIVSGPATGHVLTNGVTVDTVGATTPIRFIDGTLYYDPSAPAAQVLRLYQAGLGRAPDQGGLGYWTQAIQAGSTLDTLSGGFLGSAEFAARFGAADPAGFVTQLYQNVLGRPSDSGGLTFWVNRLAQGSTKASVLSAFSESPENKSGTSGQTDGGIWVRDPVGAQIARLYDTVFGRKPDLPGLTGWVDQVETGAATMAQVTNQFIASPEFLATYGGLSNGSFVQTLYVNTLHRTADPAGLNYWLGALATGAMNHAAVVIGFSESVEHQANTASAVGGALPSQYGIQFLS